MGCGAPQCFTFFLLYLILGSGSSAEKPPLEAIQENKILDNQENQILSSSSVFTTQLDTIPGTIPIVNPATPDTTTPVVNPTSPPAPTTMPTTQTTTTPASSGGAWCFASPSASETALQVALDYACGYGGADCSAIQPSGSCYNPNTVRDHASYAFNDYYRKNPAPTSCVFGGTAQLTYTDLSSGNCHYASVPVTTTPTPPSPPPPSISSPVIPTPTITTPTMANPGGSTIYGSAEPTGTPSSAACVSCSLLLLFAGTGLLGPLVHANYL